MQKAGLLISFIAAGYILSAQTKVDNIINVKDVTRIQKTLSSDEMLGRAVHTPGIEKAAEFIASEFKKAGLQTLGEAKDFRQDEQDGQDKKPAFERTMTNMFFLWIRLWFPFQ